MEYIGEMENQASDVLCSTPVSGLRLRSEAVKRTQCGYSDAYSERHLAVMVDGECRKPRTPRGIKNCMSEMLWGRMKKGGKYPARTKEMRG